MNISRLFCILFMVFAMTISQKNLFSQCSPTQSQLTLTIDFTLDNYPGEDAWKLINLTTGTTVDSTCFGAYSSGGVVKDTFCVNPGDDYTLLVLDDYGDGLDGSTYQLSYTYGNSIGGVSNTNKAIPYPNCGAIYSTNTIVDSITFKASSVPAPPCQTPSDLRADSWITGSASLSWTENDTASQWQIEYGSFNFTLGNGTKTLSSSNPTIINNLPIAAAQEFYVRSICSPGDTSSWAGPLYFKTACSAITTYPYQENFNDTSTSCWRKAVEVGNTNWQIVSGTASDISAPYEGTGFMEKDYTNSEAIMVSPPFDLSSLTTTGQINLFLHRHDRADPTDQYVVFVNDTPNYVTADTLLNIHSRTNVAPAVPSKGWYEYFVDLPAKYNNKTVYIIIQGLTRKNIFSYDLGVDHFTLREAPSCPAPNLPTVLSMTDSSASLAWTENGTATSWEIEYGTKGFTQGSGNKIGVSSNPFSLNGLIDNTPYDFYVRAICGTADSSTWSGSYSFKTKCLAVTSLPFAENFDGPVNSAGEWACWKIANVDGNGTWRQGDTYLNTIKSPPYAALGMGNNDDHLISPKIVLPNRPTVLTLWDKVEHSTFNNIYEILVSNTGDSIHHFTDTLATINAFDTSWTKRTIYLSAYAGQEVYISIHQKYSAADYYGFGIDNFLVDTTSACVPPSNIELVNLFDSTAVLSWIENGNSVSWEIQYGSKGFALGNGITDSTTTTSALLDSLSSNTQYDFYVRSSCLVGGSSQWSGPYTFKTLCVPVSLPYNQDFGKSSSIPVCWRQGVKNLEKWLFTDTVLGISHVGNKGKFYTSTISGGHFAYVDDSSPHGTKTALYTPLFDLRTTQSPMLSFFKISDSEDQRNVEFKVEVWDGTNWNVVFFSDTNSWNGEWEQITVSLSHLTFMDRAQVKFEVYENNGQDVADDVAIDDFFIGAAADFIPFNAIDKINTVNSNGVANSLNLETYTAGIIGNISYFPSTTQAFTLVDTSSGEQEGIHVYSPASMGNYVPKVGDFVVIKGLVGQENGLQVFYSDSLRLVEENRGVQYRTVNALTESTESQLVILEDLQVSNIQMNQSWMNVTLTKGANTYTAMIDTMTTVDDQLNLQVGDQICYIKGVGMQNDSTMPYLDGYYLSPTASSDLVFQPIVDLGNDTTICDTAKFQLDAGSGFVSYVWNTGAITQKTAVSSNDTIYIVTVTDLNGCSVTDSIKVISTICTGIEKRNGNFDVFVYPNPSSTDFNVKIEGMLEGEIMLRVIGMDGRIIQERSELINQSNAVLKVNMEGESKGIYFLQLKNKNQVYNQKLIVQ